MSKGRLDGDIVMTEESRDAPFPHSSAITVSQQCYLHHDVAKYIPCLLSASLKLSLVRILPSVERGEKRGKRHLMSDLSESVPKTTAAGAGVCHQPVLAVLGVHGGATCSCTSLLLLLVGSVLVR